jgi:hypothetical protein
VECGKATFKPFVLVTHAGRFRVPHPDFIDIPPHDAEEPEPSFIVVYTKTGTPRYVVLSSTDHIASRTNHQVLNGS